MNNWLNGDAIWNNANRYKVLRRSEDFTQPGPAETWVFIEERPESVNDATFVVTMNQRGAGTYIVDFPANYHNGEGGLSFADGHCETHKWRDARTTPPVSWNNNKFALNIPSPDNQDVAWLQEHTTGLR
jgi:prepilin-type processing-associated H-X9-DG protein